jgi:hypothetical protein
LKRKCAERQCKFRVDLDSMKTLILSVFFGCLLLEYHNSRVGCSLFKGRRNILR